MSVFRMLTLFLFQVPVFLVGQKKDPGKDAELVSQNDTLTYFDYRLKRNPGYFFEHSDSVVGKYVHLFRGQPIAVIEDDSVFLPEVGFKAPEKLYKLDLQLRPVVYAEFGDFRESLRTQLALAPRFAFGYEGFYTVFQWILPFQNDFENRFGFQNRPGELGLGYTKIISGLTFINAFLGTFTNDRYGGYLEFIRATANHRMFFGASIYQTGRIVLDEGTIFREQINYFSGEIFALYRFKHPNISIRLAAERFLRDDTGGSIEIMRQFGNTDIGFSLTESSNGSNAQLFIAFSLGGKFYSNKWFQFRPPHTFRFNYDLQPNTGIAERTRPFTNFFYEIYRFNVPYIQSQLNK